MFKIMIDMKLENKYNILEIMNIKIYLMIFIKFLI